VATLPSLNRNWEDVFRTWGGAPSNTEQGKCENAVRKAIDASRKLSSKTIEVFAQGSYANRTNVRQDSDVDICVLYKDAFYSDYSMSQGLNGALLGFVFVWKSPRWHRPRRDSFCAALPYGWTWKNRIEIGFAGFLRLPALEAFSGSQRDRKSRAHARLSADSLKY
jgi:predicted nucleotidyltransferase